MTAAHMTYEQAQAATRRVLDQHLHVMKLELHRRIERASADGRWDAGCMTTEHELEDWYPVGYYFQELGYDVSIKERMISGYEITVSWKPSNLSYVRRMLRDGWAMVKRMRLKERK